MRTTAAQRFRGMTSVAVLVTALTVTGTPAAPAAPVAPAAKASVGAARAADGPSVLGPRQREFSPNGDGVSDRLAVRYRLPRRGPVRITVARQGKRGPSFGVPLGTRAAGAHTWRWDGRTPQGRRVPHGAYEVTLRGPGGTVRRDVQVDLRFQGAVEVAERYGAPRRAVPVVHPHSEAVRDGVQLRVLAPEARRARLVVRDKGGKVVERRRLASPDDSPTLTWEARDAQDRPLPPGRYRLAVRGVDRLGNTGTGKALTVRVSGKHLVWREETRVVTAEEWRNDGCDWIDLNAVCWVRKQCGEVRPSERFPGGLAHRAGVCTSGEGLRRAETRHFLPVPDAARGVAAIRVAFTGAPTTAGESDVAYLSAGYDDASVVSSSTGAVTPWVEDPELGKGSEGGGYRFSGTPPGASWAIWTDGDDAFDVAGFTVDLRYLVLA